MQDLLIVDGYNILNTWPELVALKDESLDHARNRLLDIMANYQGLTGFVVIVVFDAHLVKKGEGSTFQHGAVEVIFTQEKETADLCIEKLVGVLGGQYRITVATSDWAQQRVVLGKGALRLSARELLISVKEKEKEGNYYAEEYRKLSPRLEGRISQDNVRKTLERWRRGKN